MLFFVIFFILGTAVGSFLNVLIDRLPNGENPFKGRSRCDYCNKALSPLDLVPVVSFLFLKGRCRYCKKKLSIQYPLVELVTGIIFVLCFWFVTYRELGISQVTIFSYISLLTIFCSFLVIFVADSKYQIIPDLMLVGATIGLFFYWLSSNIVNLVSNVGSGVVGALFFLLIYAITRGKGMGMGDIKLAFVLGLFLGFPKIVVGVYLAFLTGAILGVILILIKKKSFGQRIAFGPFLIIGASISFFVGDIFLLWYSRFFI